MSPNCYKLKRCGTPSSFMFVVLHLFYLVLDPGQVPDCKEFLAGRMGWGVGGNWLQVLVLRVKHTQFYGFLQDCSCFKVVSVFGNDYRASAFSRE